ncbi:mucin-binding protein [Ligilactobacillus acidipiscis]|uniref:mucin-binding protein n=1 Tax=Ligilactobacillus acidipiscis TaxID=89059 RepID=UPI0023F7C8C7|nr:MucBP domain-containing protein [Ligilactobacillus acidipiscis]WEV56635.1 MucBP domain-containing protein [Ligilactobacillus acidipiscis]
MKRNWGDTKEHYKMYKSGKHWVYAAITVFSLGFGGFTLLDQTTVSANTADNSTVIVGQQGTNENQKLDSTEDQVKSDSTAATEKEVATDDKAEQSDLISAKSTDSKVTEDDKAAQEKQEEQQEEQQEEDTTDSSNQDKKVVNDAEVASIPTNEQDTNSNESQAKSNADAQPQVAPTETSSAKDNETTATQSTQKADNSKKYQLSYSDLLKELDETGNDYSHVTKDNFKDYFELNGDADYDAKTGTVTLTPNENNKVGNFTLKNKINLDYNFTLTGQVNLGSDQGGADGIGLAFHNGNINDVGISGGNNGIAGLENAFGFKLDTWHNDKSEPNPSAVSDSDKFGWAADPDTNKQPFGGFVETHYKHPLDDSKYPEVWWAETAQNEGTDGYQTFGKTEIGSWHDFTIDYNGTTHEMELTFTLDSGKKLTWKKTVDLSKFDGDLAAFMMTASTGGAKNQHQFRINEFNYVASQKAKIHYVDQDTNTELTVEEVEGHSGETIDYSTEGKIKEYKKQGYVLESNEFANGVTYDNDALTDQDFYVYFTHGTVPVDPANPVEPNGPIDPENPDGPKYPSDINDRVQQKTITRTIHYKDKETGKEIDKTVTQEVAYKQVGIVDTVTGDFLGYDTTGDGKVDTQDSDKAWIAVDDKNSFDQVTSPDKSSLGYTAPDKAQVDQKVVSHADENEEVTVYYGHQTVPVNPENPGQPGDPINPADPDGPKWPADSGKESLTKPVKNTVNYVDENGNKLSDSREETVNFEHSYTIDKVTGEISNEKWTPEQTFKDATSPEVHGYHLQDQSQTTVKGQTVDHDDKDLTTDVVYVKNGTIPVDPANPVEPNGPIDPENPDGPKYPSDINDRVQQKTITRTIHYKDKETGQEIDKTVTQKVTYKQIGIVDTHTGEFLGYDTNGDGKVDTQDSDEAWVAVNDKDSFDQVTSPDKNSLGYTAPDKAQVEQKVVSHTDHDEEVTIYYGHQTVPVNPENPGQPGDPINPTDPDGPKWPADSGKESLTKPVKNTVNYVDENGNKLSDSREETVNFEHSYTIDKVTGEISNEKWTPDQTFKDVASPEVHGYHLQDQSQTTVKGQTVGHDDKDLTTDVVYVKNGTIPVDPANPVEPNGPIDPENPDGPKYPSDINDRVQQKTITRTIHYKDKETGKEIDKTVTQEVTYKQIGVVDTHTGEFLGYDTTGDGKVDTQDSDKAWIAVDDKNSFDQVTSPDKSSLGYTDPDKAQVDQKAVSHADESEEVTVYYGHQTVPVNPENPGQPGDPINPADPDGPKWPADSGKESLTKPVKNTVNYVDENGNKLVDPHEETVNFEHSYTIDKVTGEISNEKWTPDQTFKDATSPEVHGYHLQDQSQTTVKGQTVGHDDKDLTTDVVYVRDKGTVTISYVDRKGKEVAKGENVNGNTGDKYTSDSKAVDGYVLVETPANANGEIVKGNTQVTYVYAPVGNLVPSSEDPDFPNPGNTQYPNDPTDPTKPGTVEVPDIPGYTPQYPDGTPVEPGTVITPEDPTKDTPIVYVRDKGSVEVNYVDQNGKHLTDTVKISGNTGDKYDSSSKVIPGYVLTEVPANASGEITKGETTVTYVYTPVGSLVPSSEDPNFPNPGNTVYPNDPTDPNKVGTVIVPNVPGYTPYYNGNPVKPGTVLTPEDPTKDINVIYVKDKEDTTVVSKDPGQPETPNQSNGSQVGGSQVVYNNNKPNKVENIAHQSKNELPQTGEKQNESNGVFATILAFVSVVLGMLGINKDKRRKKNF